MLECSQCGSMVKKLIWRPNDPDPGGKCEECAHGPKVEISDIPAVAKAAEEPKVQ